ncbi:hypothetical protein [Thomasclavelia cocleata]|uniref:hypothetical protein n=1 Tax=Thomasclavelia cocleata TaxID=69824 RepID=UPI002584A4C9|nr:hypothetical protein [Thomasclavelia cocleata]
MSYDLKNIFPKKYFVSLKKSSLDTKHMEYMVENDFEVLKLDDYNKNAYQQEMSCPECLKGGDACFEKNEKIYIIEFKNTYLDQKKIYEIMEKMYASCIVLMDKLDADLSYFKENVCFVVVYTFKKDCDEIEKFNDVDAFQSMGMNRIKNAVARRSTKMIKKIDNRAFGLKKLEKYIYNEVNAIPVNYFQKYLQEENITALE